MRIALLLNPSQYYLNTILDKVIQNVLNDHSSKHTFYNITNKSEKYLKFIHLGIRASILLNAKAIDFVITGCDTGQGASLYLNAFPGVICGCVNDPTDVWIFQKDHKGNAISLALEKRSGLGCKLKWKHIFHHIFSSYKEDKQSKNIVTIKRVKSAVAKGNFIDVLESFNSQLLYNAIKSEDFLKCYYANSNNVDLDMFILNKLNRNNQLLY